jgi:hypothetical protein
VADLARGVPRETDEEVSMKNIAGALFRVAKAFKVRGLSRSISAGGRNLGMRVLVGSAAVQAALTKF